MPEAGVRHEFVDPAHFFDRLDCERPRNVVESGSGYGLFTFEVVKRFSGTVYALDIEPAMLAATTKAARQASMANVQPERGDLAVPLSRCSTKVECD